MCLTVRTIKAYYISKYHEASTILMFQSRKTIKKQRHHMRYPVTCHSLWKASFEAQPYLHFASPQPLGNKPLALAQSKMIIVKHDFSKSWELCLQQIKQMATNSSKPPAFKSFLVRRINQKFRSVRLIPAEIKVVKLINHLKRWME